MREILWIFFYLSGRAVCGGEGGGKGVWGVVFARSCQVASCWQQLGSAAWPMQHGAMIRRVQRPPA